MSLTRTRKIIRNVWTAVKKTYISEVNKSFAKLRNLLDLFLEAEERNLDVVTQTCMSMVWDYLGYNGMAKN